MAVTVFPLDPVSGVPAYAAQDFRQIISALCGSVPSSGRPLGASSGVRIGTPASTVTVSGSTVTVNPHSGVVDIESNAAAGPYFYAVSAATTATIAAASGSNPRIDLVSVQVADPTQDSSSTPGGSIVVTTGTAAATPSPPPTPAGCFPIAQVQVPTSGTGSPVVVWTAPYIAAAGGITPVSGTSQYPASPYAGQHLHDQNLGYPVVYDGTGWEPASAGYRLGAAVGANPAANLNTTNQQLVNVSVTFTIATRRLIQVKSNVTIRFQTAPPAGTRYNAFSSVIAGTSANLTGNSTVGDVDNLMPPTTGGYGNIKPEGEIVLGPGTYTAFPVVQRVVGGNTNDLVLVPSCRVFDCGPA